MTDTDKKIRAFLKDLLEDYRERDFSDIDGGDFQDLLIKHGFLIQAEITKEECEEDWALEWGYEPGDLFNKFSPLWKEIDP